MKRKQEVIEILRHLITSYANCGCAGCKAEGRRREEEAYDRIAPHFRGEFPEEAQKGLSRMAHLFEGTGECQHSGKVFKPRGNTLPYCYSCSYFFERRSGEKRREGREYDGRRYYSEPPRRNKQRRISRDRRKVD